MVGCYWYVFKQCSCLIGGDGFDVVQYVKFEGCYWYVFKQCSCLIGNLVGFDRQDSFDVHCILYGQFCYYG